MFAKPIDFSGPEIQVLATSGIINLIKLKFVDHWTDLVWRRDFTNNPTLYFCLLETLCHKVHYFSQNQYLVLVTIMQF